MDGPEKKSRSVASKRYKIALKRATCCALLAAAATTTIHASAKQETPALFSRTTGTGPLKLPDQALTGKSLRVKINRGQLRSGRLSIPLPGAVTLNAIRDLQQEMGHKRFAWVGHVSGEPADSVVIGVSGDAVAGTFKYKGKLFKLEPRPGGSHILSQVTASTPAPELDPIPISDPAGTDSLEPGPPLAADDAPIIIDVLVAYTPAVQSIYGSQGAEALIIQAVAETNQAYANSGINPRINLVHSVLTNYTESGNMGTDLSRLKSTNDGYMDELHTLRDNYGADLVSLIQTNDTYCGFAYRMSSLSTSFASSAFSTVRHSCATGYYSFAHELGHNQGAQHDSENGTGAIYPYAYGYQDPFKSFRTVMALNCSGSCPRVDHFSNPDIFYNGATTGVVGSANNALTLNTTAATVASFRQQATQTPPQPPSGLEAVVTSDSAITLTWTDNADNETGFTLERSDNNWGFPQIASLPANTTSYLDNGLDADTLYSYRVRSFNGAGNSSYSNTAITATDPIPPPNAPSGLAATAGGTDRITITWTDTSNSESGFTVQRRRNGSAQWLDIGSASANSSTYTDTDLEAGTLYYYRVAAYNDAGTSGYSNSDSAETDGNPVSKLRRQQDWPL